MPWSTRRKQSSLQNDRSFDQSSQSSSQNTSKNLDEESSVDSSPLQLESPLESTPKQSGESLSQNIEPTQIVFNSQSLDRSGFEDDSNEVIPPTQIVESTQITANISPLCSQEDDHEILPTQIVPSSQTVDISSPSPEEDQSILPTQIVCNISPKKEHQQGEEPEEEEELVSTQLPPGASQFPPTQIVFSPEDDSAVAASQDVDACVHGRSPNKRTRMSPVPSDAEDNDHDKSVEIVSSKALALHHRNSNPPTDAQTLQCGICLEDITELGEMDSGCGHSFCFPCILEWSRVTNLCAMCKKEFKNLTRVNLRDSTRAETLQVTPKKQRVHDEDDYYYDDDDGSDSMSEPSDYDLDVYDVSDMDADYHPPPDAHNPDAVAPRRRTRSSRARRPRGSTPRRQPSPVTINTPPVVTQSSQVTPPRGAVWVPPTIGYSPVSTPPLTPVHPRHSPFRLPIGALHSPIPRSHPPTSYLDTSLVSTPQSKNATPPETPSPVLSPEIVSTNKSRHLEPPTTISSPTVSPIPNRAQRQESTPSPTSSPSPSHGRLDTSSDVLNFDFRSNRASGANRTASTLLNNNNNSNNKSNNSNNQDAFQPVKQPGRLTVKSGSFPASFLRTHSTIQPPKENDQVLKKVWKEFDSILKKKGEEKKTEVSKQLKKTPSDPTKKGPPKKFDLNNLRFNNKKGQ